MHHSIRNGERSGCCRCKNATASAHTWIWMHQLSKSVDRDAAVQAIAQHRMTFDVITWMNRAWWTRKWTHDCRLQSDKLRGAKICHVLSVAVWIAEVLRWASNFHNNSNHMRCSHAVTRINISVNADQNSSSKATKRTEKRLMLYNSLPWDLFNEAHSSFNNLVCN